MTQTARARAQPPLVIKGVSFRYPKAPATAPALDHVDALFTSRSVAVLGPNGAGKSTLFRLVSGTAKPTSGEVEFGSLRLSRSSDRERFKREIGVMPQHLQMFPGYRCGDFLRYVCWLRRVPPRLVEDAVQEALAVVSLQDVADRRIKTLSGGMRQRLGLAQAVVSSPQLLILDEPTVGLDPGQRVDFRAFLTSLKDTCTIVFATHLVDDVAAIADEVLVLSAGRQLFTGTLPEFVGSTDSGGRLRATGADVETAYLSLVPRGTK